jgi:hypothetical protein
MDVEDAEQLSMESDEEKDSIRAANLDYLMSIITLKNWIHETGERFANGMLMLRQAFNHYLIQGNYPLNNSFLKNSVIRA